MSYYVGPDVSLTGYLLCKLIKYREEADGDFCAKVAVGIALIPVALLGVIETVARGIFSPIGLLFGLWRSEDALNKDGTINHATLSFADKAFIILCMGTLTSGFSTIASIHLSYLNCFEAEIKNETPFNLTVFC